MPNVAINPKAIERVVAFEIKPIKTGPNKNPPMANVFMMAKPDPLAMFGTLDALA